MTFMFTDILFLFADNEVAPCLIASICNQILLNFCARSEITTVYTNMAVQ